MPLATHSFVGRPRDHVTLGSDMSLSLSNVPAQLCRAILCASSAARINQRFQILRRTLQEIADSAARPRQRFPTLINATRSADSQVGLSRSEHRSSDRVHWLFGLQDYVTLARSIRRDCRANPHKCQRILTRLNSVVRSVLPSLPTAISPSHFCLSLLWRIWQRRKQDGCRGLLITAAWKRTTVAGESYRATW